MTRRPLAILSLALLIITAGCLGAAPAATGTGAPVFTPFEGRLAMAEDRSTPTTIESAR